MQVGCAAAGNTAGTQDKQEGLLNRAHPPKEMTSFSCSTLHSGVAAAAALRSTQRGRQGCPCPPPANTADTRTTAASINRFIKLRAAPRSPPRTCGCPSQCVRRSRTCRSLRPSRSAPGGPPPPPGERGDATPAQQWAGTVHLAVAVNGEQPRGCIHGGSCCRSVRHRAPSGFPSSRHLTMLMSLSGSCAGAALLRRMAEMTLSSTRPTVTVPCPAANACASWKGVAGTGFTAASMVCVCVWKLHEGSGGPEAAQVSGRVVFGQQLAAASGGACRRGCSVGRRRAWGAAPA